MAHPKRRQSSTRQAKRRTHDKAVAHIGSMPQLWRLLCISHSMPHLRLLSW